MQVIQNRFHPNICLEMGKIQRDLEVTLNKIFDKAGSNIHLKEKTEYIHQLEATKQGIERIKDKYCSDFSVIMSSQEGREN